jgi:methyl-accepting chemotaxis protein
MLRQLNIRKRLALVYLLLGAMIAIVGGFGIYSMKQVNDRFERYTYLVVEAAALVADIRADMVHLRRYEKDVVISVAEPDKVKDYITKWEATYTTIQKNFDALAVRASNPASDRQIEAQLQAARESLKSYHDTVAAAFPTLAGMDVPSANKAVRVGRDGFVKAEKIMDETGGKVAGITKRVAGLFKQGYQMVVWVTLGLVLAGVALTLLVGRLVSNSIVVPMREAERFASQVRDGDLTGALPVTGRDEAAELSQSLVDMQTSLQQIVGNVRQAADSIQVASSEVASGNQDLSHRTEQTAASLQQTASAMNELTATVEQTADSARTASQLAGSASSTAERGGAVVGEVVTTMERINSSSRRISDIIGTIDGIAFQTNILALNAAVEAARAGEAGRGFAVVASEVRSLAQRSAEAAREIKTLIGASVESVEAGTRLVADAGQTMGELVASVQRVTDIIGEISAAAGEQSGGIGSVNGSIAQLDQATQQNAALVEESAAAAQSLRDQAQKLAEVVSTFRLPGGPGGMAVKAHARPSPSPAPVASAAKPALKTYKPAAKPAAAAPKPSPAQPKATPSPSPAPAAGGNDGDWETF